ncbi:MAG: hypothetical protein ACYC3I_18175 [Gemmataceae bacterium]
MPYELRFSDQPETVLAKLPPHLLNVVEQQLSRLAEQPATLSRPAVSPPYPPGGQMYYFKHHDTEGTAHHFTVLFHYASDETTLFITGLSYLEGPKPGDP